MTASTTREIGSDHKVMKRASNASHRNSRRQSDGDRGTGSAIQDDRGAKLLFEEGTNVDVVGSMTVALCRQDTRTQEGYTHHPTPGHHAHRPIWLMVIN